MLWGLEAIVFEGLALTKDTTRVYSVRWNGEYPVTKLTLNFNILHIYLAS